MYKVDSSGGVRNALSLLVGGVTGVDTLLPRIFSEQRASEDEIRRVLRLPTYEITDVQVLDPESPDFGKFVRIPDYDGAG